MYKTVDYLRKVEHDMASFVSSIFIKIKDVWKESPANYVLYKEYKTVIQKTTSEGYYDLEDCYDEDEYYEEYGYAPDYIEPVDKEVEVRTFEYKSTKAVTLDR